MGQGSSEKGVKEVGEVPITGWIELVLQDLDMGIKEEEPSGGGIVLP